MGEFSYKKACINRDDMAEGRRSEQRKHRTGSCWKRANGCTVMLRKFGRIASWFLMKAFRKRKIWALQPACRLCLPISQIPDSRIWHVYWWRAMGNVWWAVLVGIPLKVITVLSSNYDVPFQSILTQGFDAFEWVVWSVGRIQLLTVDVLECEMLPTPMIVYNKLNWLRRPHKLN